MFKEIVFITGQIFGIAPIVFGFLSFQAKSSKGILIWQIGVALAFSLHYLMIGALTGMALNLVGAAKSVSYFIRDKMGKRGLFLPIFFAAVAIFTTVLTWQGFYSIFLLTGLLINTLAFALLTPQKVRYSMLIKAPVTFLYNAFVFSVAGMIYETIVFVSSVIGLVRYRQKEKA